MLLRLARAIPYIALIIALTVVSPLHAATVSTNVEANINGAISSDPQGPANAPLSSSLTFPEAFTIDFTDDGLGRASMWPDGSGAVLADAVFASGSTQNTIVSRVLWSESDTNNTGADVPYDFAYVITPASLRIADFAGLEDTDPSRPDISFELYIRANGATVFSSTANLIGGSQSHVLNQTGTSLNPSFVGPGSVFGYDFQSLSDVIPLGLVGPGESITVEYEMIATVATPGFEAGGQAQVGDPFDLGSSPGFQGALRANGVVAADESSWGQVKSLYR